MFNDTKLEMNHELNTLKGRCDGDDVYKASNNLARLMVKYYDVADNDGFLSDWLFEGDYDGSETIESLIEEWNSLNS